MQLLLLRLDDRRYALPLDRAERLIHAVDVTPLPNAPPVVRGVINVHGQLVPVVSLRQRVERRDDVVTASRQIVPGITGIPGARTGCFVCRCPQ